MLVVGGFYGTVISRLDRLAEVHGFVMDVYRATKAFPRDEVYGLASQLRRASLLVPTYVAEGQARLSGNDFYNYLGRARGALVEVETQPSRRILATWGRITPRLC